MPLNKRGLLILLLAIALAVLTASLVSWWRAGQTSHTVVDSQLTSGQTIQRQSLERGHTAIAATATQLAEDRAFAAYIAASLSRETVDTLSIRDLLEERAQEFALPASAIISAAGTAVVGTGPLRALNGDVGSLPGVNAALADAQPATGYWLHEQTLMQVALAPLRQGPLLEGLLVVANPVDATVMAELASSGALDAHLMLAGNDGQALLAASSDPGSAPSATALARIAGANNAETGQRFDLGAGLAPARVSAIPDFAGSAWLLSAVPAAVRAEQARQRRNQLLWAGAASLLSLLLIPLLLRSKRGANVNTPAAAHRDGDRVAHDQRRSKELQAWLARDPHLASGHDEVPTHAATGTLLLSGRYQVLVQLGENALATSYRALDRQEDKVVLLLALKAGSPRETARNFRIGAEYKRALRLAHPNLVRVLDVGQENAVVMIAIEHLPGLRLRTLMDRHGPLPVQAAILVAKRLCSALKDLHDAGVLIRHIDADQVLFQADGRVKLLPLALLPAEQPDGVAALPALNPEQWLHTNRRGDLRAFGLLLSEMLTGARSDRGEPDFVQRELMAALPAPLLAVIERCLHTDAAQGYPACDAVLADLERL